MAASTSQGVYGAVAGDESEQTRMMPSRVVDNIVPPVLLKFLEGDDKASSFSNTTQDCSVENGGTQQPNDVITFRVMPESLRFISYVFFWLMCAFAMILTKFFVRPLLLAGPVEAGNTCPPFDPNGQGFDVETDSHLMRVFGYNNICANWDYSPSRELTAMVYPLFEYSLLLYLVIDFIKSAISYKKHMVSYRYWTLARICFPLELILCAWFRMIFVVEAYTNVRGHTAGFVGLQLVLIMVAIRHFVYVLETQASYDFLGGIQGTRMTAYTYIVGDLAISAVKVYLSIFLVIHGKYPEWAMGSIMGMIVGHLVDVIWMIFNALLPLIISWVRASQEKPLVFTIDMSKIRSPTS